MRQFRLINGNGETFDLMRKDAFFHAPGGLGFDREIESMMAGYEFVELRDDLAQKVITGEMVFLGYEQYKEFIAFIGVKPLRLEYKPLNQWHRIRVKVQRLGKTEISRVGRLICAIDFLAFSTWYNVLNYETVPEEEPEDENLMVRGTSFYAEDDGTYNWAIGANTDADDIVYRSLVGNTAPSMNTVPVQLPGFAGDTYQLAAGDYYFKAIGKRQGVRSYFKVKPLVKTASGNPIQISDAVEVAPNSLEVSVSPKQDGTPWIGSETDTDPYTFRAMPSIAAGSNREYDKLIGASVVWNQRVRNGNFADSSIWSLSSGTGAVSNNIYTATNTASGMMLEGNVLSTIQGHIYYIAGSIRFNDVLPSGNVNLSSGGYNGIDVAPSNFTVGQWTRCEGLFTRATGGNDKIRIYFRNTAASQTVDVRDVICVDLTQLFGNATTAASMTVSLFKKMFPKPYYAYDAGSLQSVSVSAKNTTGKNQLDKATNTVGYYISSNGTAQSYNNTYSCTAFIEVLPNTTYTLSGMGNIGSLTGKRGAEYSTDADSGFIQTIDGYDNNALTITTSANTHFLRLTILTASADTAQVELGSTATTYEAYAAYTYALDDTELRGLFSIVDGELVADGDEYPSSGTVTRKYGTLTFDGSADESWTFYSGTPARVAITISDSNVPANERIMCNRFLGIAYNDRDFTKANTVWISPPSENLLVVVGNFTDLAAFKTSLGLNPMSIVYAATSTTESVTGFTNPQIIDPNGTESYTDAGVDAGTRDVAIPVGHSSYYALQVPITGMDEINVDVSGKNLLDKSTAVTYSPGVYRYVAFGVDAWSDTTPNGSITLPAGQYTFSYSGSGTVNPTSLVVRDPAWNAIATIYSQKAVSFTLTERSAVAIYINFTNSINNWADYQIQLEIGSTATDYVPYAGSTTYTHTLSPTMYGGQVEMVSGVETTEYVSIDLGSLNWTSQSSASQKSYYSDPVNTAKAPPSNADLAEILSPRYGIVPAANFVAYGGDGKVAMSITKRINVNDNRYDNAADFKTAMSGVILVYKLETPTTASGTPDAVILLKGENVISTDGDSIDLNYDAYPDSRLVLDVYGELAPDPDSAADTQVVANFTVYADQEVQFYMDQEDIPFDYNVTAFLAAGSYPAKKIYGYPYPYSYADSVNGEMDVFNGSTVAGYCRLTIHGPVEDPIWAVYQNGQLLQRGKITATIPEGHTLVVDSSPTELEISERTLDGELVANRYADSDFSTVRFITIPPGSSKVVITQTGDEPITAYLEVDELEATV